MKFIIIIGHLLFNNKNTLIRIKLVTNNTLVTPLILKYIDKWWYRCIWPPRFSSREKSLLYLRNNIIFLNYILLFVSYVLDCGHGE